MRGTDKKKPLASLSLDLDDHWSYLKTRGMAGWDSYPSFLPTVVPRALDILGKYGLRITFFVVGQDAALVRNQSLLRDIAAAGHEIGNHSFHHEPWLHLYTEDQLEREVVSAEEAIAAATGYHPRGFRGPGFSTTPALQSILARRGYGYDASRCGNLLAPLARLYYNRRLTLTAEQRRKRSRLNGGWRDVFGPNRARVRMEGGRKLAEVPVTTMPLFRLPFHISYLQALGVRSSILAMACFRSALSLCVLTANSPSILLHPTDILGADDGCDLSFFPAMALSAHRKMALVEQVLRVLTERYDVVPVGEHADYLLRKG